MIIQKSAETIPLTRELAVRHATMPAMICERQLRPVRLMHFTNLIRTGRFGCPVWSVAVDKNTGAEFRADGQHTSTVLTQISEEEFPASKTVLYREFEIESLEDAIDLFYWFDNIKSARQPVDCIGIYLAQHHDVSSLSRNFSMHAMRAVDHHVRDLNRREPDDRQSAVHHPQYHGLYLENPTYREFALWLHRWEKTKNAWLVSKSAVGAEVLADWLESPKEATAFWHLVFTKTHPNADHISRKLSDKLNEMRHQPRLHNEAYRKVVHKMWETFRRSGEGLNGGPDEGSGPDEGDEAGKDKAA